MRNSSQPIGIFDSGIGGLTVLQELSLSLPQEQFIYFGDTAHLPYGNKSKETVLRYCLEISAFLVTYDIKLLIVACNTATAYALSSLQQALKIPVLGVIEPAVCSALQHSKNQKIAILGTEGTIESQAYQDTLQKKEPKIELLPIACPLFVPLVEEGWINHPITFAVIKEYLEPLVGKNIDTLILGCTHYPLLLPLIQTVVGKNVKLITSGKACATEAYQLLKEKNLLSAKRKKENLYFVSDAPKKFEKIARTIFGENLEALHLSADI